MCAEVSSNSTGLTPCHLHFASVTFSGLRTQQHRMMLHDLCPPHMPSHPTLVHRQTSHNTPTTSVDNANAPHAHSCNPVCGQCTCHQPRCCTSRLHASFLSGCEHACHLDCGASDLPHTCGAVASWPAVLQHTFCVPHAVFDAMPSSSAGHCELRARQSCSFTQSRRTVAQALPPDRSLACAIAHAMAL